jgi:hypothetical protein
LFFGFFLCFLFVCLFFFLLALSVTCRHYLVLLPLLVCYILYFACVVLSSVGNFPPWNWGKQLFTLGLGPIFGPQKTSRKITASILTPFS